MAAVLNIVLPVLAGASLLLALYFVIRGLGYRTRTTRVGFGVAQQEARLAMQTDFVRAVAAGFVGLILFALIGLSPHPEEPATGQETLEPAATSTTDDAPVTEPAETATQAVPTPLPSQSPQAASTETPVVPTVTNTPVPATPTPSVPVTATVSSGVGVWLRGTPGLEGEQLEWLLDGTVLTLLSGSQPADDMEWQQVRSPDGVEGWVAVPFIVYAE